MRLFNRLCLDFYKVIFFFFLFIPKNVQEEMKNYSVDVTACLCLILSSF